MLTKFTLLCSKSFPSASGTIENVFDTPSWHTFIHGIFATELSDAKAPFSSLPCIGLAPGAKASPAFLPSGVVPVFLPYITLEVIVNADNVCLAFLYNGCFLSSLENLLTNSTPKSSALSSSLPYLGKSPSTSKSTAIPFSFLIGLTFAYLIADNESIATERPAIPNAINLPTSVSCNAICTAS